MSLRTQPTSERAFATLVILALGVFLAGALGFIRSQEGVGRPGSPAPVRSRLTAVLEGVMAPNVSPAEAAAFRTWIQGGATREGFAPVEAIVSNNCASCHSPGGQFPRITGYEDLRPLALEEAAGGLFPMIGARALHLALLPLAFLVLGLGYLRRAAWRGRGYLLGICAAAVLFDALQWGLRPGPASWAGVSLAASGALAMAYLASAAVVLKELWAGPSPD